MATLNILSKVAPGLETHPDATWWLTEAVGEFAGPQHFGAVYGRLIANYAAHCIACTPDAGDYLSVPPGAVSNESAGSESIGYAIPASATVDDLGSTKWGQAVRRLRKRANARGTLL